MSYQRTEYGSRNVQILQHLVEQIKSHSIIGIISMEPMSGQSIDQIRKDLRSNESKLVVAKNTLMRLAIEKSGLQNGDALMPYVKGSCAFLFSNQNAFTIAQYLDKNKVPAAARPGQIAPIDVTVMKMNTGVPPGSFISELNSVGLPTKIERGTIAIPKNTTIIKAGDVVPRGTANILGRLGLSPFEVGLTVTCALQDGMLIENEDLLKDYNALLGTAHQQAVNLAAKIGYVTDATASAVLGSAQREMLALARALLSVDVNAVSEELAALASATPVAVAAESAPEAEKVPEEEEEEEADEADMGLGSLFG